MSEQHPYRGTIPSVPEGRPRPLWSVMIPTYNSAGYLRATLASVLAQDPGPDLMQITVVDNCSTRDDPQAVVEELGRGRVEFYRQPENVGHVRNFTTCLQRSRGQLVHLLHSDDLVRPGFYQKLGQLFEAHREIGAALCRHIDIDERGHWQWIAPLQQSERGVLSNWLARIAVLPRLQMVAMAVRRDVYERLGGFDQRIRCYGEDWEMEIRIAAHYPVAYEPEPLALYRKHTAAQTGECARTGQTTRDLRTVVKLTRPYLPAATADKLSREALENSAFVDAFYIAEKMLATGNSTAALVQIREALKISRSPRVIRRAARLALRAGRTAIGGRDAKSEAT